MTQKAGTPPDGGAARLLIGVPLGLLIALAIASMIGWLILGLPVAAYDPLKLPQFVWYYRGDARVVRAMAGGLIGGGLLLGGLIYALWARGAPLHGAARFARESEIKSHGFRARSGIVLGRKSGRFLTFGGSEHVIVEAPTRSGKGTGIVIPNLLTWQGSVVVLDVKRENYDASAGFPTPPNERRRSASLSRHAAQATAPLHGATPAGDVAASGAKTRPLRHRRSAASRSERASGARTARREARVPAGQPKDSAPLRSAAGKSATVKNSRSFSKRSWSSPEGPRLQAWFAQRIERVARRAARSRTLLF